jgi:hypothetical protein
MDLAGVDAYEIQELLPKLDCGLCQNPLCMTFARKILLGLQKPIECRFISTESLERIQKMIPKKEIERRHPHPNIEQDVIEIHPCTESGKVTLETQLKSRTMERDFYSDFFGQFELCDNLSEVEIFDKVNCSSKMGYGLVESKGKRMHIFKTGKIIMRRADDKEDALSTFSNLSRILLPARICSCENILGDCFGGSCDTCQQELCAAQLDFLEISAEDKGIVTVDSILRNMNYCEELKDNFNEMKKIVDEIRIIYEQLKNGAGVDKENCRKNTDEITQKINKSCIQIILKNDNSVDTIVALIQYGLNRDLIRARDGFLRLEQEFAKEQFQFAVQLFFDAWEIFEKKEKDSMLNISQRYEEFLSKWEPNQMEAGIAKIATNGFYISRILGKPVPDKELLNKDK